MSTTLDKAVAIKYGKDSDKNRDLSFVFEFPMDGLNKGAIIQANSCACPVLSSAIVHIEIGP